MGRGVIGPVGLKDGLARASTGGNFPVGFNLRRCNSSSANPSGSPSVAVREERRGRQNGSGWADQLIDKPVSRREGEGKKEREKEYENTKTKNQGL